jgi:hypothetical protein
MGKQTCECVMHELAIWTGQVNLKYGAAADKIIKKEVKVTGQQRVLQTLYTKTNIHFAPKNYIIVKVGTVYDGTIPKATYTYILHNFPFSFLLMLVKTVFHTLHSTLIH